jgi:hypothetical protein
MAQKIQKDTVANFKIIFKIKNIQVYNQQKKMLKYILLIRIFNK